MILRLPPRILVLGDLPFDALIRVEVRVTNIHAELGDGRHCRYFLELGRFVESEEPKKHRNLPNDSQSLPQ